MTYTTQAGTLKRTYTYYDTGMVQTAVDVNNGATTYAYGSNSCAGAFPTTLTFPITTLSQSMKWNCDGGVMTQLTDANGNYQNLTYNDPNFWRPTTTTDFALNPTTSTYGTGPLSLESSLNFNGGTSTADLLTSLDSMGRTQFLQKQQAQGLPGTGTYDSVQYAYDGRGMQHQISMPYAGSARQSMPANWPVTTWSYDALGRTTQVADGDNGAASWAFSDNDVLQTVASPSKQRQYEYDGLGRLTSVCELTAGTVTAPAGTCGQIHPQTGYWTKYTYDTLNNLTTVTQNAQSTTNNETRTYSY